MSLDTPTTQQINDNIIVQLEASLNQSIPLLPKSFLRVLARTLSGVFILLYKYAGFMHLQQFVRYASFKETTINGVKLIPLVEWGLLIGVGEPATATAAELNISVIVETQGGILEQGAQLVNPDTGVIYLVVSSVSLNAPVVSATVRAAGEGIGAIGNMAEGATLSFANPLSNVARDTEVINAVATGADAESEKAYRQRVLDRFQKRPQGGAYADYEQWGEEAAGILNVYPYTADCPGQVDVYVEATPESSGNADGIPTEAQLQSVLDAINYDREGLASRRPANALVNAYPIKRLGFEVIVTGVEVDNIADATAQIEQAIKEYFLSREPYILGLSVLPRRDRVTRSALGGVVDDIVSARGGIFSAVILRLNGENVELYTLNIGEKAKAAEVTFK